MMFSTATELVMTNLAANLRDMRVLSEMYDETRAAVLAAIDNGHDCSKYHDRLVTLSSASRDAAKEARQRREWLADHCAPWFEVQQ